MSIFINIISALNIVWLFILLSRDKYKIKVLTYSILVGTDEVGDGATEELELYRSGISAMKRIRKRATIVYSVLGGMLVIAIVAFAVKAFSLPVNTTETALMLFIGCIVFRLHSEITFKGAIPKYSELMVIAVSSGMLILNYIL